MCPALHQYETNTEEAIHTKAFFSFFSPALGTYIPLFHTNPDILSGTTIPKKHHDHVAGFTVHKF